MKDIKVLYAEIECDGRRYIYSPDGKPAGVQTGEPYCGNPHPSFEILVSLDASHLYPAADEEAPKE